MHKNAKDITGQRFGSLVVIAEEGRDSYGMVTWRCKCDCGRETIVKGTDLRSGHTKSCGCQQYAIKDLTGEKYGRLLVLKLLERRSKYNSTYYECLCDCGKTIEVMGRSLKNGHTKSCGCYKNEKLAAVKFKHGMAKTPLNSVFSSMKSRCYNSKDRYYCNYGERGIYICAEWLEDRREFFIWAIKNGYVLGAEIDRIDNDGPYSPENCRWATRKQNSRNKRTNHLLTFGGKTQSTAEWSEETGIVYATLAGRIRRGFSIEEILSPCSLRDGSPLKKDLPAL